MHIALNLPRNVLNAKHIILIDVLVEMEMILNISRIWLSFF